MKLIMRTEFGSSIYGTRLPTSDVDYKGIFLPEYRDIVLQRAKRVINKNTKKNDSDKNTADDIDEEFYSVQEFLKLLAEGQTVSIDILFAPEVHHTMKATREWEIIQENKHEFIHSGVSSFVGYCQTQAAKYGIKGSRVASLRNTLEWLKCLDPNQKLYELGYDAIFRANTNHGEFCNIVYCNGPNGREEPHLEVCNRKIPFHASVKYATQVFQKIFDNYGERALLAEKNEGVDFKALMHAVRVARTAEELLLTGKVTFPRPEKDLLLQIRKGELPYQQVAEIIEEGLDRVKAAQEKSVLRKEPNFKLIDDLVFEMYTNEQ